MTRFHIQNSCHAQKSSLPYLVSHMLGQFCIIKGFNVIKAALHDFLSISAPILYLPLPCSCFLLNTVFMPPVTFPAIVCPMVRFHIKYRLALMQIEVISQQFLSSTGPIYCKIFIISQDLFLFFLPT